MQKHVTTGGGGGGGGDDGEEQEEEGRKEQRGQRSVQTNQRFSGTIELEVIGFSWVTDWVSTHRHLSTNQTTGNTQSHFKCEMMMNILLLEMFGGLLVDWLVDQKNQNNNLHLDK